MIKIERAAIEDASGSLNKGPGVSNDVLVLTNQNFEFGDIAIEFERIEDDVLLTITDHYVCKSITLAGEEIKVLKKVLNDTKYIFNQ